MTAIEVSAPLGGTPPSPPPALAPSPGSSTTA